MIRIYRDPMTAGERQQQKGRDGVYFAREWLESTTRVEVPWVVYEMDSMTTLPLLDGSKESWDLAGYFTSGSKRMFFAEVKNYETDDQGSLYKEYLADCYSATAKMIHEDDDRQYEFMWITWHPFAMKTWTLLCDPSKIEEAVAAFPGKLGGCDYEQEIGQLVAERLWLLVLSRRQAELMMDREYLGYIRNYVTSVRGA